MTDRTTWIGRLFWSAYLAHEMRGQAKFPFLPSQEIARAQSRRIRRMVRHAYRNVPYYRRVMDRLGIGPAEIRTADDLARLPVVERSNLQQRPEDYRSTTHPEGRTLEMRSGGTSGAPRAAWHDLAAVLQNAAHGERERCMHTHLLGLRYGYREIVIGSVLGSRERVQKFLHERTALPGRAKIERRYLDLLDPPEMNIPLINEFRPDVIVTYGSYLEALCRRVLEAHVEFHKPKMFLYGGDTLSPSIRKIIEREFDIPIWSTYQAIEAFKIAFECSEHAGLHVNVDLYPARIVDTDGRGLRPGETGSLVISNLVNRATVLLNYRLGDLATWMPGGCPCGRNLPRIEFPEGRIDDWIRLPEGRHIHPQSVRIIFTNEQDVWQYQVVQRHPSAFLVRLVARHECDRDSLNQRIRSRFGVTFGPQTEVDIQYVDTIPRTPAGKVKVIIKG
jgi:phenylacetate-CoA ligase